MGTILFWRLVVIVQHYFYQYDHFGTQILGKSEYLLFEYKKVNGEYETKGNCKLSLRHLVELRNNLVVRYDTKKKLIGTDDKGRKKFLEEVNNVRQEKLDEKSKKNLLQ